MQVTETQISTTYNNALWTNAIPALGEDQDLTWFAWFAVPCALLIVVSILVYLVSTSKSPPKERDLEKQAVFNEDSVRKISGQLFRSPQQQIKQNHSQKSNDQPPRAPVGRHPLRSNSLPLTQLEQHIHSFFPASKSGLKLKR